MIKKQIEAIERACAHENCACVVPQGWKLVPIEPTIRQLAAMGPAIRACYTLNGKSGNVLGVYEAALSAAPTATIKDSLNVGAPTEGALVTCGCGDQYPMNSYEAGFIEGRGHCENCDAMGNHSLYVHPDPFLAPALAALHALEAAAETSLDMRPEFRRAIADAYAIRMEMQAAREQAS